MPRMAQRTYTVSLDPGTGLYDGPTLRFRLAEEMARSRRYGYPLSLAIVTFRGADRRLVEERVQQLALLVERHVREADIVARCGPDSLAVLLPHTDEAGVRCLGERVQQMARVMQLPAGLGGNPLPVHVGFTTVPQGYDGDGAAVVDYVGENLRRGADGSEGCCIFVPLPRADGAVGADAAVKMVGLPAMGPGAL